MFNYKIVLFIVFCCVFSCERKRKMSIVIIVFLDCLQTQKKINARTCFPFFDFFETLDFIDEALEAALDAGEDILEMYF